VFFPSCHFIFDFRRVSAELATNGQGLAKFGNLKIVCPEPMMLEKLMIKIRTKSPIEKLPPELKPNSELMNIVITSAQILPNPMFKQHLR
jgi:hypothetical protein